MTTDVVVESSVAGAVAGVVPAAVSIAGPDVEVAGAEAGAVEAASLLQAARSSPAPASIVVRIVARARGSRGYMGRPFFVVG
jgi:hypothetical protein